MLHRGARFRLRRALRRQHVLAEPCEIERRDVPVAEGQRDQDEDQQRNEGPRLVLQPGEGGRRREDDVADVEEWLRGHIVDSLVVVVAGQHLLHGCRVV
jgi:hypothetical protein